MVIGDYYKTRKQAWLTVSRLVDGNRQQIEEMAVKGKKEAKQLCKDKNVQPWNF